jgi:hypothetical protein
MVGQACQYQNKWMLYRFGVRQPRNICAIFVAFI